MEKIVEQIKQLFAKLVNWIAGISGPKNPADTEYNKQAQKEYGKMLNAYIDANRSPTEEQEVILFAQAYQMQIMKNPASAKFMAIEDYSVSHNEGVYTVSGYFDATNSYGAQVREGMKRNITKQDDQWICTDKHISIQTYIICLFVISILISIIIGILSAISIGCIGLFSMFLSLL